ncbi:MAG TPA: hypothetical protein VG917_01845 [Patescibacteria group bacterium]|nr:hypothetical protein [Patescibacteria group bacterium]
MPKTKTKKGFSPLFRTYFFTILATLGLQYFLSVFGGLSTFFCVGINGGNIIKIKDCPVSSLLDLLLVASPIIGVVLFINGRHKLREVIMFAFLLLAIDYLILISIHMSPQEFFNHFLLDLFKTRHYDRFT